MTVTASTQTTLLAIPKGEFSRFDDALDHIQWLESVLDREQAPRTIVELEDLLNLSEPELTKHDGVPRYWTRREDGSLDGHSIDFAPRIAGVREFISIAKHRGIETTDELISLLTSVREKVVGQINTGIRDELNSLLGKTDEQ